MQQLKLRGVSLNHFGSPDPGRHGAMNRARGIDFNRFLDTKLECTGVIAVSTKAAGSNFSATRGCARRCIGVSNRVRTREPRRTVSLCDGTGTLILDKSIRQPISI